MGPLFLRSTGGGPPRAAIFHLSLKIFFWWENNKGKAKNSGFKKSSQKFMESVGKNLEEAANLRSAPGGKTP